MPGQEAAKQNPCARFTVVSKFLDDAPDAEELHTIGLTHDRLIATFVHDSYDFCLPMSD